MPLERPDGDDQRPVHGAEFGPHLRRAPLGLLGRRRAARPGQGDRGEPGVTRPAAAGPVHQEGSRAEDHGGRAYDPPLQHAQEVGAGAFGVRAVVPGDDERGAASAERHGRAERGVQTVRVHQVGARAGGAQGGHRPRVAAARHGDVLRADAGEAVGAVRLFGGAHRDPHAPCHEPGGQRAYVRAAGGVAAAQHLHGAQRRLAVRCVAAHGGHVAGLLVRVGRSPRTYRRIPRRGGPRGVLRVHRQACQHAR